MIAFAVAARVESDHNADDSTLPARRASSALLATFATLALVPVAARAEPAGEYIWSGAAARGTAVRIRNTRGDLFVQRSDDGAVHVRAQVHDGGNASRAIGVSNDVGGMTIQTLLPKEVRVDELVLVPSGVDIEARNVDGQIVVEDAPQNVNATTVEGDIHVAARGAIAATTTNGSIVASIGVRFEKASLLFRTANGSITIEAPKDTKVVVKATAPLGTVTSSFPLVSTTSASGPATIDAQSGTGSITVRAIAAS